MHNDNSPTPCLDALPECREMSIRQVHNLRVDIQGAENKKKNGFKTTIQNLNDNRCRNSKRKVHLDRTPKHLPAFMIKEITPSFEVGLTKLPRFLSTGLKSDSTEGLVYFSLHTESLVDDTEIEAAFILGAGAKGAMILKIS